MLLIYCISSKVTQRYGKVDCVVALKVYIDIGKLLFQLL